MPGGSACKELQIALCAGNVLFSHTTVVSEIKIVREMLCFTIGTDVGGCEGRR